MKIISIIPARMASTRLPNKPMAKINGKPMIGHVYEGVKKCSLLLETYVATCDQEIADYVESINGKVIMTSDKHERASDRTAEAMLKAEEYLGHKIDIIIMVQGDEPLVSQDMIEKSIKPFNNDSINVVNLMSKLSSVEEFQDANEVKVVLDSNSNAIYFSREPIPSRKKGCSEVPMIKQVGIISFRRDYLLAFNNMAETELERIESIDMNRIIENGGNVRMVMIDGNPIGVDTKSDLVKVSKILS